MVGDGPRRPPAETMSGAGGELAARVGAMSLGGEGKGGGGNGGGDKSGGGGGKNKKKGGGGGGGGGGGRGGGGKWAGAGAGGAGKKHGGAGAGAASSMPAAKPHPTPASVVPLKPGQSVNVRIRAMHSELDARYRDMVGWCGLNAS